MLLNQKRERSLCNQHISLFVAILVDHENGDNERRDLKRLHWQSMCTTRKGSFKNYEKSDNPACSLLQSLSLCIQIDAAEANFHISPSFSLGRKVAYYIECGIPHGSCLRLGIYTTQEQFTGVQNNRKPTSKVSHCPWYDWQGIKFISLEILVFAPIFNEIKLSSRKDEYAKWSHKRSLLQTTDLKFSKCEPKVF